MSKYIRAALIVIFAAILVFSGWKLFGIYKEYSTGTNLYSSVASGATSKVEQTGEVDPNAPPITVDFEALWAQNEDVVAWIYSEGTVIDYPVLQGYDNNQYLRHMIDGSYNSAGSIFLDADNSPLFSDPASILYGHNMDNKSMFAALLEYNKQEYYDEHPRMWLFTPQQTYHLEVLAGCTVAYDNDVYARFDSTEAMNEYLYHAYRMSSFASGIDPANVENLVVLSTCSYAYENARYILLCDLVPVEE